VFCRSLIKRTPEAKTLSHFPRLSPLELVGSNISQIIWPNLSDENNGAGLVTYMRLVDGGSPAIGGDGKQVPRASSRLSQEHVLSVIYGTYS
jgi:hypothetical protein